MAYDKIPRKLGRRREYVANLGCLDPPWMPKWRLPWLLGNVNAASTRSPIAKRDVSTFLLMLFVTLRCLNVNDSELKVTCHYPEFHYLFSVV